MGIDSPNIGIMELVEAKLETVNHSLHTLGRDITEVRIVAEDAKKEATKAHECSQASLLKSLSSEIGSWAKWWRGIMVTILIGTVGLAGWIFSIQSQKDKIVSLEASVTGMSSSVNAMSISQQALSTKVSEIEKTVSDREDKNISVIKAALKEVLDGMESKRAGRPR